MCVRYKSHTITIRNVLQMCVRYKSHTITIRLVLQMCVIYKSHTITIRNVLQMCVRYKLHTKTIKKWTCDPKIWRSILIKITTAIDTERSSGWLPWSSVEIWKASFNVPGGHQDSHPGNLSIFVAKIQTNLETIISSGLSLAPFAMSKRPETDTMIEYCDTEFCGLIFCNFTKFVTSLNLSSLCGLKYVRKANFSMLTQSPTFRCA